MNSGIPIASENFISDGKVQGKRKNQKSCKKRKEYSPTHQEEPITFACKDGSTDPKDWYIYK